MKRRSFPVPPGRAFLHPGGLRTALMLALLLVGSSPVSAPQAFAQALHPDCPAADALSLRAARLLSPALRETHQRMERVRCLQAAGRLREAGQALAPAPAEESPARLYWHWLRLHQAFLTQQHEAGEALFAQVLPQAQKAPTLLQAWLQRILRVEEAELAEKGFQDRGFHSKGFRDRAWFPLPAAPPLGAPKLTKQQAEELQGYLTLWLRETPAQYTPPVLVEHAWAKARPRTGSPLGLLIQERRWRLPATRKAVGALNPTGLLRPPAGLPIDGAALLERIRRLYALGLQDELARAFEAKALPHPSPWDAEGLRSAGRYYLRSLLRSNATQRALRVLPQSPQRFAFSPYQQAVWEARIRLQARDERAAEAFWRAEQENPAGAELSDLALALHRYHNPRSNAEAQRWRGWLLEHRPRSPAAVNAVWQAAWSAYRQGALEKAERHLRDDGAQLFVRHPVRHARMYYWRARIAEQRGNTAAATRLYAALRERWPYSYYTAQSYVSSLSAARTAQPAQAPARPALPTRMELLRAQPEIHQALLWLAAGLHETGHAQLGRIVSGALPPETRAALEELSIYLQLPHLQLRLVANHHLQRLRTSRPGPTPFWRFAFPRPYWTLVRKAAAQAQISPWMILAIIREESRFDPWAHSRAGARGLMQLMPATARDLAKRHTPISNEAQLYEPARNIQLGARYLGQLLRRFDGNPLHAAAAFNAGPGRVSGWLRRMGKTRDDEFVERIYFQETQDYVRRVRLSLWAYAQIYPQP